jgi:hypothetical protein
MRAVIYIGLLAAVCLLVPARAEEAAEEEAPRWPRELKGKSGATLTVYQPQVEEWKAFSQLTIWIAVSIQIPGEEQEEVGGLKVTVETKTDEEERTVVLQNPRIVQSSFPGLDDAKAAKVQSAVEESFPTEPWTVSLDRILASMEREKVKAREVKANTDPPKFIMSRVPGILVALEGEPVPGKIEGTDVSVILNTATALFQQERTKWYYMLYGDGWIKAPKLSGPWSGVMRLPVAFEKLPKDESWKEIRENIPGRRLEKDEIPKVYVSFEPTELLVTYGEPTFKPVPDTRLMYVDNTESDLFLCQTDGMYYVLVSGRWFRTRGKHQPIEFCSDKLPEDFSKIPPDHTCGRVLASVPGTDQAEEAVIANEIPRRMQVDRAKATIEVSYEGEPAFEWIEGTKVEWATNTSFDVFRVAGRFYCCYEAAWFEANAPEGPWTLCNEVPKELYDIPSSHPAYNDTYVTVCGYTDDWVEYCYWPGYYGSYYYGGTVLFGTGWRWRWRRAFWLHWHRHRPVHYRNWRGHHPHHWHRHFRYGHGRYYDHLSGRYRRGSEALLHHKRTHHGVTARKAWQGNTVRQGRRPQGTRPGHYVKGKQDLYVGRSGEVYRRNKGEWQKREGGSWQGGAKKPDRQAPAKATQRPATQRNKQLNRSTRSRTSGAKRQSQYRSYRSSRGTRASSYRRSSGYRGGYRGGGSRGGGRGGGRR